MCIYYTVPNMARLKCHMVHPWHDSLYIHTVYRNWFQLGPAPFLATPELSLTPCTDMGGNEGGGDRWSFFGTRSVVQKSPTDPGSETSTGERFALSPASESWLYRVFFFLFFHHYCTENGEDFQTSKLNLVMTNCGEAHFFPHGGVHVKATDCNQKAI